MSNNLHPVLTKDYPENAHGGVMVCGINFGYSKEDALRDMDGQSNEIEPVSFFSDTAVNSTRFRNRLLTWLSSWDINLATRAGNEGSLERSFFQTNWLDTQTNSITSDGTITNDVLVEGADCFLRLLEARKPKAIIFVGAALIQAFNDIRLRDRVVSILGERSGNAEIHRAPLPGGTRNFKLMTQSFGSTTILSLPHVQTRGLTDDYMANFKPIVRSSLFAS